MSLLPAVLVALGVGASIGAPAALAADACSNAAVRAQQGSSFLPGCRAYEQVSPSDKGGSDARHVDAAMFGSANGERFVFAADSSGVFGGGQNGIKNQYVATRGAPGWASHPVSPYAKLFQTNQADAFVDFACDLCASVVGTTFQPIAEGDDDPHLTGQRADVYISSGPRDLQWISGGSVGGTASADSQSHARYAGRSTDGTHVAFDVGDALLPEVEAAGVPASARVAYERTGPGLSDLRVVGKADDGSVMPGGSVVGGGLNALAFNGVSRDGSRIVFQSPGDGSPAHLYVRIDGSRTVEVSAPQCSGAVATCDGTGVIFPYGDAYLGATPDLETVFFMSSDRLVDADTNSELDIYRYDLETAQLTRISVGPTGEGITGTNVIQGISEDGGTLYFTSQSALMATPNGHGEQAAPGAANVYGYRGSASDPGGTLRFVGDYAVTAFGGGRSAATTADGGVLLFHSYRTGEPIAQIYRYEWDTGRVACLTCAGSQLSVLFSQRLGDQTSGGYIQGGAPFRPARNLSADGRSVFFESESALVSRDTNGRIDVYEWRDGELFLLSSGTSSEDSYFHDASGDGQDVFIGTWEALAPSDTDAAYDVYAVRRSGGWLSSPAPGCSGDGCQGSSSSSPGLSSVGSSLSGWGNVASPGGAAVGSVRVAGSRAVRGSSVTLRVKAPDRGRIRISGPGLKQTSRQAARARTYRVEAHLSASARRKLRSGERVTVRVLVRFVTASGKASSARIAVTFKPPARGSSRRANAPSSDIRKGR